MHSIPNNISTIMPLSCLLISSRFQLKVALFFFKIIGLIPFTVKFTKKNPECNVSPSGYTYNTVLIILTFAANFLCIPNIGYLQFLSKHVLTQKLMLTKAIIGTSALFLLWSIMCSRQKDLVKIFNKLMDVDNDLLILDRIYVLESANIRLISLFLCNSMIWIGVLGTDGFTYLDVSFLEWLMMLIPMMIPSLVVNWLLILYTMVLCLLEIRFISINRAIIRISHVLGVPGVTHYESSTPKVHLDRSVTGTLVAVKRAHAKCYDISNEISHFYSVPLLIAVSFFCGTIIYNAYHLVAPMMNSLWHERIVLNTVNGALMLTMQLFPIVVMTLGVNRITREMNLTADAVHKLLACSIPCREVKSELKKFSFELLHQNVEFTAHGVFPLDCTLVHSICSIVVTYLVILVQIQGGH